ncbi:hypothetical protein KDN34_06905 [Shewanella yunxiaonensis]|uniref:Uncharacterized protein n=1 Tax=Shewanella yunxiaonensis TaxID=2829809 RepID=A0ABX7YY71_9GAMM|nr:MULTISPECIES: hypothetical protein [Shewanella]MDF0533541.1 hypothetical protein [Shewanella sp. A32]QUN07723.1 hypothetical protein KDN34_06905 [Shewanella yunxiaonensis]
MMVNSQIPDNIGDFMDVHEYQDAYYQIQDDVIESLPVKSDEEALLD